MNPLPSPPPVSLQLVFRVASFLRAGQPFDLDNMVTPVFEVILGPRHSPRRRALTVWSAVRAEDPSVGLLLRAPNGGLAPFPPAGAAVVGR